MKRNRVKLKPGNQVTPCPNCGNNTSFCINAKELFQSTYEIWVECICEYDPTSERTGFRDECSHGQLEISCIKKAFRRWNLTVAQAVSSDYFRSKTGFTGVKEQVSYQPLP